MNSDLAAQHAMDRLKHVGIDGLTEVERTTATVWLFDAGVSNQGFRAYFASHPGDLAFDAPRALAAIGAHRAAALAAEANALFGTDPPRDRRHRTAWLATAPASVDLAFRVLEERYLACDEDIDGLLERYLESPARPV